VWGGLRICGESTFKNGQIALPETSPRPLARETAWTPMPHHARERTVPALIGAPARLGAWRGLRDPNSILNRQTRGES
jgi:hypothetical protein